MPNLAISLHATTDEQRTALVPPNKKYPLAAILEACRRFPLKKRSRITFEYVMLDGVNDTPEDARRLVKLLSGIKAKVNLIPLNPGARHSLRPAVGRSASIGSRRFSPTATSRCRCERAAGATSAPRAVS